MDSDCLLMKIERSWSTWSLSWGRYCGKKCSLLKFE
jgi:hypothetical protein